MIDAQHLTSETRHPVPGVRLLEDLAALLDYPGEETGERLEACLEVLRERFPEAEERLAGWRDHVREQPVSAVQELYTHTFDINPVCTLDVGYYLFGEDYQRGLFLAKLRESQEEVGLEDEVELPDHLPVLLRWLARIHGSELYTDVLSECLLPVLRQMDGAFAAGDNPYRGVLQTTALVLERDLAERGVSIAEHPECGVRNAESGSEKPNLLALYPHPLSGAPVPPCDGCRPFTPHSMGEPRPGRRVPARSVGVDTGYPDRVPAKRVDEGWRGRAPGRTPHSESGGAS